MEGGRKVKSGIPGPGVRYVAAAAAGYKMAGGGSIGELGDICDGHRQW